MDDEGRRAIALWRLSVLGPLISARLEHGDRSAYFEAAAARSHVRPDGRIIKLSPRTIEDWYHQHRAGGFEALMPQLRGDQGKSRSIRSEVAELILRIKRENPRRSIRRIIRILERAHQVRRGELSKSSVHRLLWTHHASQRPPRAAATERRSFLPEHAGDLLVGDSMHGPPAIAPDGKVRKTYLLSQIDGATRYVPHSYFAVSEGDAHQEHGLKQALLKHGLFRAYYVDLGSAYIARSLVLICAELEVRLLHTGVGDCEAKGVIERWHRTWRDEVGDELPKEPLPLAELNSKHWAWLSAEYHDRKHDTTGRAPREHWLSELSFLRPLPRGKNLDEIFLHRERRKVRKTGTVRFGGRLLEVRPELVGRQVELRFDPLDTEALPRVFVDGAFFCDTVVQDLHANASRRRRRIAGDPDPFPTPTGLDPLALIEDEHYRRTRPVSAALDSDDDDDNEEG
jgi:transposase InsO family protein